MHIDSPLRGLGDLRDAPVDEIRSAPREAFRRLVRLARDEDVDFVVLSGDVFDGKWSDMGTALFFISELKKLAPIPVFIVKGNHDAETELLKNLPPLAHVHTFRSSSPETQTIDAIGVAIHAQSYGQRAVIEDLAANYPPAHPEFVNIGVLHTGLSGGYEGHDTYAPCTLKSLIAKGYDYWALGHIHTREVLHEDPLIVYPGNLQGRHIRETGPKGCYIVEGSRGDLNAHFHALDVVRWIDLRVDVGGAADDAAALTAAFERIQDLQLENGESLLCVRVTLTGATDAHRSLVRSAPSSEDDLRARVAPEAWLVELRIRTTPLMDFDAVRKQDDLEGELFTALELLRAKPETDEGLRDVLKDLKEKIPSRVLELYGTSFDEREVLRSVIADAETILAAEILGSD